MEIIRERICPERDGENFGVCLRRLNLILEGCVRLLDEEGDGWKWVISGREMAGGVRVKFTLRESDFGRRMKLKGGGLEKLEIGGKYQFVWRILERKRWTHPTNGRRFKMGRRIEVFGGFRKMEEARFHFSPGRYRGG